MNELDSIFWRNKA